MCIAVVAYIAMLDTWMPCGVEYVSRRAKDSRGVLK